MSYFLHSSERYKWNKYIPPAGKSSAQTNLLTRTEVCGITEWTAQGVCADLFTVKKSEHSNTSPQTGFPNYSMPWTEPRNAHTVTPWKRGTEPELGGAAAAAAPLLTCAPANTTAQHLTALQVFHPPECPARRTEPNVCTVLSNLKDLIPWNRGHKGLAGLHAIMLSAPLKGGFHGSKTPLLGNSEIFSEVKLVRNIYQSINSAQLALVRSVWEHRYLLQRINSGDNKNWRPRVWGAVSPLF